MSCNECENKSAPEDKTFTGNIIEINNPETRILLRKVEIPASMGTEEEVPASIGKYRNVILHYEANDHTYIYSSDGIPTAITANIPQEIYDSIANLEAADVVLQREINEVKDAPAFRPFPSTVVTDGTTQQFMNSILALHPSVGTAYLGTVSLSDMPTGLVQEEVEVYVYSDHVVYCIMRSTDVAPYAWWCASYNYQGWRPMDTTYTAGSNVSISSQNVISATDTTYSNFTGTDGTSAGASGLVPAPATTDAGKFLKADGTWDTAGGGSSYTAGDGIDITNDVISATNTGKARVLTTADYNWPTTGTKTSVALWLLEDGLYSFDNLSVRFNSGTGYTATGMAIVNKATASSAPGDGLVLYMPTGDPAKLARQIKTDGSGATVATVGPTIANNLTTGFAGFVLDASQGKVLKDLVDSLAFKNAGAPTTATVGTVGQLLEDTTNGKLYQCTAIDITDPQNPSYTWKEVGAGDVKVVYLTPTNVTSTTISVTADKTVAEIKGWADADKEVLFLIKLTQDFGGFSAGVYCFRLVVAHTDLVRAYTIEPTTGGVWTYLQNSSDGYNATVTIKDGAPTVVQTTGTSTTDVMSQNAVTSMVFQDPSTKNRVQIGNQTTSTNYNTTAIGAYASAQGAGSAAFGYNAQTGSNANSVALGRDSYVTRSGEVNIGSGSTGQGFNSSNYRVLGGLYDPQSAHDAATKNYVDTVTPTITMQTTDPGEGATIADNTFIAVYVPS